MGSLLACFLFAFSFGQAQSTQIKGSVKGPDGAPLVGATVALASSKSIATVTGASGNFTLNIPAGKAQGTIKLSISSIGFQTKEIVLENGQSELVVLLESSHAVLNEVVVTALGINRQKRSIAYSVTEVKGEEFTTARENNVANALTGKVAGVNAAGLSTGPGGSSRVTIRGNGSLNGDNQPLYVVNGMPIDNSVPGGAPTVDGSTTNVDRGDGIAGINPDDIETISVLKGGTAAALYGSRASNGVILITTKKGRAQKGIGVDYSSTATIENPAVIPQFQFEYGQGNAVIPTDLADAQATGRRSWGAKIDGSTDYVAVDGKTHPYTAKKRNVQNFYQTGSTFTNTLAMAGGNQDVQYRFSAADLNSQGILPKTTYERKTFNVSLNAKLNDQLSFDAVAQYNLEVGHDRTGAGDALGNPNWTPLLIANTADVRWLKPGYDANGNEVVWNDASIASNGYFVINKFQENDTKNRFIGQGSITYKLLSNLIFKGTVSRDFYSYDYYNILPTGTLYTPLGQYQGIKSDVSETNSLVTGTYTTPLTKDIGFSLLGGFNSRKNSAREVDFNGSQFIIPYFYTFANLAQQSTALSDPHIVTNSIFGSADFDYKKLLFITVTGREDWFSTLNPQNDHIFYPSVGGSFILSDAVKLPSFFNFAKLRSSWAQVGGGAPDPYAVNLSYSNVASAGQPLLNVSSNNIANPNLKPYTSTTFEAGFETQMLGNRLGLDFTYYKRKTRNDIVNTSISETSGYNSVILNVGELQNQGVEILVTGKLIRKKNFGWNVSYNVAYNDNKVIQLASGLDNIQIASTVNGYATLNHIVGRPFGTIMGTSMQTDAKGNIVFDAAAGTPVVSSPHILGNSVAPTTMGLTNEFHYKNFSFSFLLDGKFGNKIFSVFEVYATRMGKLTSTLPGRENGLVVKGVDQSGNPYSNTISVGNLAAWYNNIKSYSDHFIHDGSFVKLRQTILTYNIPVSGIKKVKLQGLSLSFVARNLLTLYKETKNFDPEQSFTNSNGQGFESIGLPRTRSLGLNLAVKF